MPRAPADPAALASAVARLAADAALRADLGRCGREIIRDKFDYDAWIRRTVEVFEAAREVFGTLPR
jgi:glycosyltransferase involved in cell wall biosynthesis